MKLWLSVREGAEYAGVCRDTVYSACERREIRHARVGGRRAIHQLRQPVVAQTGTRRRGTAITLDGQPARACTGRGGAHDARFDLECNGSRHI